MRIEDAARASRWRGVTPVAKASFALAGLLAAFLAPTPALALAVAALLLTVAVLGGGVPLALYARVAAPALGFLALSGLTLALAVDLVDGWPRVHFVPEALPQAARVITRALAALAALLGLVLTTPLPDLLALLRRLRVPAVLLDLMVLGYRMLFVLHRALSDTATAQHARLGYATTRNGWRSLGSLGANLAVQVWTRAQALQQAAEARNLGDALRFLPREYAHARRDTTLATLGGALLIALTLLGDRP